MKKTAKKRAMKKPEPLGMPDWCRAEAWDRYAAAAIVGFLGNARSPFIPRELCASAAILADSLLARRDERFR